MIGSSLLYKGLAVGQAAIVAPTAAVVSVVIPIIVGTITQGAPGWEKYLGMLAGTTGIWLISRGAGQGSDLRSLLMAVLAGFGFSGYFLCIVRVSPASIFAPLMVAKLASLAIAVLVILAGGYRLAVSQGERYRFLDWLAWIRLAISSMSCLPASSGWNWQP